MTQALIFDATADSARPDVERYVVTRDGEVLATAVVTEVPDYPDALRVRITGEDPQAWSVAAEGLAETLRGRAGRLLSVVRQDHRDATRLEAAGYRLGWESWGARLELPEEGLPADAYSELTEGPRAAGYAVRELGVGGGAAYLCEAFELYDAESASFPRTPATSVQHYDEQGFAQHIARSRAFVAIREGRCAAITVFEARSGPTEAATDFTLVAARFRGEGLASFLKATAIKQLAAEGVRVFGTGGALVNKPMLRSNEKLGYVLEPFWGSYVLALDSAR